MSILKKTIQILKRSIHLLMLINIICSISAFALIYFAGRKIQTYVLMIYAYAPQLQDIQAVLDENINLADLNKLNEALAVINHSYNMILIVTVASLLIFFLIICFFQSLEWRIIFKSLKKAVKLEEIFDNYVKYALKFSMITFFAFIILLPAIYYFVDNLRSLFLNIIMNLYGLAGTSSTINYTLLVALFLLILLTTYFIVLVYIMLNKYKLRESIKKAFKAGIKKVKTLLLIHFIFIIIIIPTIYLDAYLTRFLDFRIALIISLLIYFVMIAFYQVLITVYLEKE